jgi:hypothetical protein
MSSPAGSAKVPPVSLAPTRGALRRGADDDQQALRGVDSPPASLPSKATSASSKSPVETPLR